MIVRCVDRQHDRPESFFWVISAVVTRCGTESFAAACCSSTQPAMPRYASTRWSGSGHGYSFRSCNPLFSRRSRQFRLWLRGSPKAGSQKSRNTSLNAIPSTRANLSVRAGEPCVHELKTAWAKLFKTRTEICFVLRRGYPSDHVLVRS